MAVDERARRNLHEKLEAALGPDAADTLMEEMGSLGRDQLATSHDVHLLGAQIDRDMAGLRATMDAGFARLEVAIAETRAELRGDMAAQTRQLGFWMIGVMTGLASLVFAAAQL